MVHVSTAVLYCIELVGLSNIGNGYVLQVKLSTNIFTALRTLIRWIHEIFLRKDLGPFI